MQKWLAIARECVDQVLVGIVRVVFQHAPVGPIVDAQGPAAVAAGRGLGHGLIGELNELLEYERRFAAGNLHPNLLAFTCAGFVAICVLAMAFTSGWKRLPYAIAMLCTSRRAMR